jgi:hypothetical protein
MMEGIKEFRAEDGSSVYRTTDGKFHKCEAKAVKWQAELLLYDLLANKSVGSGGEWDTDMFQGFLVDNSDEVHRLLGVMIRAHALQ